MIIYDKSFWGLGLLSRLYGSAIPRTLPAGLLSALLTTLLLFFRESTTSWWVHPFPYNIFSFVVGFIIVFRSNYGYQRYWDARSQVQTMTMKWQEAVVHIAAFDRFTLPEQPKPEQLQQEQRFIRLLVHLVSLMQGVACQALRRDPDLGNISVHNSKAPAPPLDPINLDRSLSEPLQQSIGTYSNWKDIFMLRASPKHLMRYNVAFPIPVIGHVSIEEVATMACNTKFEPCSALFQKSLDQSCCFRHLPYMERPYLVNAWLQQLLLERQREGGLNISSPVLARAYHLLSEGMNGYEQARKIADTPFPFPWSQFILLLLLLHTLTVPVLVVAYVAAQWLAIVLSTITVVAYWAMNEVARDLEDPFLFEPNDIPLAKIQYDFNETLLHTAHCVRPCSTIDHALRMKSRSYSILGGGLEDMQLAVLSGLSTTSSPRHHRQNSDGRSSPSPSPRVHNSLMVQRTTQSLRSPFASRAHNRLEVVVSQSSYEKLEAEDGHVSSAEDKV